MNFKEIENKKLVRSYEFTIKNTLLDEKVDEKLEKARLNFQMKGFRKILKIDHAYYSRVSNQTVLETLNRNIGEEKKYKPNKRVSKIIVQKSLSLLGML